MLSHVEFIQGCLKERSKFTVYTQHLSCMYSSWMFRLYICSHLQAGYRTLNKKTTKIQYFKTLGTRSRLDIYVQGYKKYKTTWKYIFKCYQPDATLYNLFIPVKCSTCFRRFLRPSPGAQTVYTISGTLSNLYCYLPMSWKRCSIFSTTVAGSSKGLSKYSIYKVVQIWPGLLCV